MGRVERKRNEVEVHSVESLDISRVLPAFWQVLWKCTCGKEYFWLVTQQEVDLAVNIIGMFRDYRKESGETVIQADFIPPPDQT